LHDPDERELLDWYEERDRAQAAIFAYAKANLTWGQVRPIPAWYRSSLALCDLCKPAMVQATSVSWNRVLYCDRHLRARNRRLRNTLKWREKVREMERLARDHAAVYKGL
jgi:hypothetical protein